MNYVQAQRSKHAKEIFLKELSALGRKLQQQNGQANLSINPKVDFSKTKSLGAVKQEAREERAQEKVKRWSNARKIKAENKGKDERKV